MDIDIFYLDWDKELKQFSGPSGVIALLFGEGRGVPVHHASPAAAFRRMFSKASGGSEPSSAASHA